MTGIDQFLSHGAALTLAVAVGATVGALSPFVFSLPPVYEWALGVAVGVVTGLLSLLLLEVVGSKTSSGVSSR